VRGSNADDNKNAAHATRCMSGVFVVDGGGQKMMVSSRRIAPFAEDA
jgi:hypothetical protein